MGMSTRRSTRLAKKDGDSSAPPTPSAAGGIKKRAAAKVKKIVKVAVTPSKKKAASKQEKMDTENHSIALGDFPHVELKDHEGNTVNTKDIADESAFVVFLYPKANTPGCTTQACGFRSNFEELKGLGYRVFGLSYDSPKSQTNWKNKHSLAYSLLCDTVGKNSLIAQLGAHKPPKSVKRSHFFVAKGGAILDKQVGISPKNSIAWAIEFAKANPADKSGGDTEAKADEEMKEGNDNDGKKPDEAEDKMAVDDKPEKVEENAKDKAEGGGEAAKEETDNVEKPKDETAMEKTEVEMKAVDDKEKAVEETAKPAEEKKAAVEGAKVTEEAAKTDETAKPAEEETKKPEDPEMKPVEAEEKPADAEAKPAEAETKPAEASKDNEAMEGDTKAVEEAAKPADDEMKAVDEMSKDLGGDAAAAPPKPAEGAAEKAATIVTGAVVTETTAKDANNMQDVQVPAATGMPIEGSTIPDGVETPAAAPV